MSVGHPVQASLYETQSYILRSLMRRRRSGRAELTAGLLAGALIIAPPAVFALRVAGGTSTTSPMASAPHGSEEAADPAIRASDYDDGDRAQVQLLTTATFEIASDLRSTLSQLEQALAGGRLPSPHQVRRWRNEFNLARGQLPEATAGERSTQIAGGAVDAGLDALVQATELLALAPQTAEFRRRAQRWWEIGFNLLDVGTTQLDALNHTLGFGHHHVYFRAR
jgi:hypothetical protein